MATMINDSMTGFGDDTPEMPNVPTDVAAGPDRWAGIHRSYSSADVDRLRSSVRVHHTLAQVGARRLWELLTSRDYVHALGATDRQSGGAAGAGWTGRDLSEWLAGCRRCEPLRTDLPGPESLSGEQRPVGRQADQPGAACAPTRSRRRKGSAATHYWFAPIVADAEAGFGGPLNAFELMKAMIEAGAAGVHFEDQLSSEKKCGHLGGKVLLPTGQFIRTLTAARLAADVLDVPTVLVARTDADSARLLTSDIDERDRRFITGERTPEGFFRITGGLDCAIARGDRLRAVRRSPLVRDVDAGSRRSARSSRMACTRSIPGKMLAYNCSPSFNWKKKLDAHTIAQVPARARRDGLQVPVRHARRLPRAQPTACSSWRRRTARAACRRTPSCRTRSSRRKR